jgi:hypothetical protein
MGRSVLEGDMSLTHRANTAPDLDLSCADQSDCPDIDERNS